MNSAFKRYLRVEQQTRYGLFSQRITAEDIHQVLGINIATAYRWIKNPDGIPALHMELLKIKVLGLIPDPAFDAWCVKDGRLVSPNAKHYQRMTPDQVDQVAWSYHLAKELGNCLDEKDARIEFLEASIEEWRLRAGEIPAANDRRIA